VAGDVADALDVGNGRAAKFHDNHSHCVSRRALREFELGLIE
jgi:hypothetical protein